MPEELLYRIALTAVPQIGAVQARLLIEKFGSAKAVFQARKAQLENTEGIGSVRASQIKSFDRFNAAEDEIRFMEKYGIKALFISDADYPQRLRHCYDPPTLLYYKGEADLNAARMVSIIGTRNNTEYGKMLTEQLVQDLAPYGTAIISGLAFGIDAIAHRQALAHQLPTVGVLAHGLDHIYPPQHKTLARQIVKEGGGLLTEFCSTEGPDKHHFPIRNRIVAGISEAVIVVESGTKGGSMVTAELANGYNKDVYCYPGKVTDAKSGGCLRLIKQQKAQLISSGKELVESLGWNQKEDRPLYQQASLLLPLTEPEKTLMTLLKETDSLHWDELLIRSALQAGEMATALLTLEMQGLVKALPGKQFRSQA